MTGTKVDTGETLVPYITVSEHVDEGGPPTTVEGEITLVGDSEVLHLGTLYNTRGDYELNLVLALRFEEDRPHQEGEDTDITVGQYITTNLLLGHLYVILELALVVLILGEGLLGDHGEVQVTGDGLVLLDINNVIDDLTPLLVTLDCHVRGGHTTLFTGNPLGDVPVLIDYIIDILEDSVGVDNPTDEPVSLTLFPLIVFRIQGSKERKGTVEIDTEVFFCTRGTKYLDGTGGNLLEQMTDFPYMVTVTGMTGNDPEGLNPVDDTHPLGHRLAVNGEQTNRLTILDTTKVAEPVNLEVVKRETDIAGVKGDIGDLTLGNLDFTGLGGTPDHFIDHLESPGELLHLGLKTGLVDDFIVVNYSGHSVLSGLWLT